MKELEEFKKDICLVTVDECHYIDMLENEKEILLSLEKSMSLFLSKKVETVLSAVGFFKNILRWDFFADKLKKDLYMLEKDSDFYRDFEEFNGYVKKIMHNLAAYSVEPENIGRTTCVFVMVMAEDCPVFQKDNPKENNYLPGVLCDMANGCRDIILYELGESGRIHDNYYDTIEAHPEGGFFVMKLRPGDLKKYEESGQKVYLQYLYDVCRAIIKDEEKKSSK